MKILNDYVLIKPSKTNERQTQSWLIIKDEVKNQWEVIGIGPGTLSIVTGVTYPIVGFKVHDVVLYKDSGAHQTKYMGETMYLIPQMNVLAVLDLAEEW